MPVMREIPDTLRPFIFHGLDLQFSHRDTHALGDCPWCGRESHFSVAIESGLWRCLVCAQGNQKGGGNALVFLRMLHQESDNRTGDYSELVADRGLFYAETPAYWSICRSFLTGEWIVPGYSVKDGSLQQLYKWVRLKERTLLMPTFGLGVPLHYASTLDKTKKTIYVTEGVWDAMAKLRARPISGAERPWRLSSITWS